MLNQIQKSVESDFLKIIAELKINYNPSANIEDKINVFSQIEDICESFDEGDYKKDFQNTEFANMSFDDKFYVLVKICVANNINLNSF